MPLEGIVKDQLMMKCWLNKPCVNLAESHADFFW